jgi:hypothetical protein
MSSEGSLRRTASGSAISKDTTWKYLHLKQNTRHQRQNISNNKDGIIEHERNVNYSGTKSWKHRHIL